MPPGRVLAIDYGRKHIGLAISDESRIICKPLATINNDEKTFDRLRQEISNLRPTLLLVGYPFYEKDNAENIHAELDIFLSALKQQFHLEVKIVDESYSTQEAKQLIFAKNRQKVTDKKSRLKQKENLDAVAAQILLQSFLLQSE